MITRWETLQSSLPPSEGKFLRWNSRGVKTIDNASSFGGSGILIYENLPSPTGKVANRAVFRDDLTEGNNKSLLRFTLHFYPLSAWRSFHSVNPLPPKEEARFAILLRSNGGIYPRRRKRDDSSYKFSQNGKRRDMLKISVSLVFAFFS